MHPEEISGRVRNLEQSPPGGAAEWGSIAGTLSSQSDLQAALDAKADVGSSGMTQAQVLTRCLGC